MNKRPKIELHLTQTDKILEILGWIAIVGIWTLTLTNYFELPEIIPKHYNGAGKADGFGSKANILILPIVSTILFVGMTILNKYPHVFNYPCEITDKNALYQYTKATRLVRFLKLTTVIVFCLIVFKTIQDVNENTDGLGTWFLPLTLGMIFIPIIYYLISINKEKKTAE